MFFRVPFYLVPARVFYLPLRGNGGKYNTRRRATQARADSEKRLAHEKEEKKILDEFNEQRRAAGRKAYKEM